MATWVLILILSGNNAGIATVSGYASIEECRLAGLMMTMTDAKARLEERHGSIVIVETRCISGPAK